GQPRNRIAAIDASTGLATAWDPNADNTVGELAVVGNTVYAGGFFNLIGGQDHLWAVAIDASTGLATSWDPALAFPWDQSLSGGVSALAVSGSTVYLGGSFNMVHTLGRSNIAALDAATGMPTAWDPKVESDLHGGVRALALDGNTLYAGGDFTSVNYRVIQRNGLAA